MPNKSSKDSPMQRWVALDEQFTAIVPHLAAVLRKEGDFRELRIKARDDGSSLAIMKVYGQDGGPMVAFGVGYGSLACLVALDATIQGGHWKVDKPWTPTGK